MRDFALSSSRLRRAAGRGLRAVPPLWRAVARHRARRAAAGIDPRQPGSVPVLVYQMGKVGSASVMRALESAPGLRRPVLHVHTLVPERLEASRVHHQRGLGAPPPERAGWMLSEALASRIASLGDQVRFPIVSLVRDPIAREVSSVFQDPRLFARELRDGRGRVDVERALAFLHQRFSGPDPCGYAERWFDEELLVSFGIDVFDEPFDRERGYQVVRCRRADLLLLRTEDLDRTLAPGVSDWLGVEPDLAVAARAGRANRRDDGADGVAYRRVLESFRLPAATVERIYAGRLARHFYGKDWLERFAARWTATGPKGQGRIA